MILERTQPPPAANLTFTLAVLALGEDPDSDVNSALAELGGIRWLCSKMWTSIRCLRLMAKRQFARTSWSRESALHSLIYFYMDFSDESSWIPLAFSPVTNGSDTQTDPHCQRWQALSEQALESLVLERGRLAYLKRLFRQSYVGFDAETCIIKLDGKQLADLGERFIQQFIERVGMFGWNGDERAGVEIG